MNGQLNHIYIYIYIYIVYRRAPIKLHVYIWVSDPVGCCNTGYPSETHFKLKSRKTSLVHNTHLSCNLFSSCQFVFEILHKARQWYCRALCKISKRFHNWETSYEQTRFHEIWVSSKYGLGRSTEDNPLLLSTLPPVWTWLELLASS